MGKYQQWLMVLLAVFLPSTTVFADPPDGARKSVGLAAPQVELANSTPSIDLRDLGWDAYQPFLRSRDYSVESFDFDDKSALERLTKLRSLSLVTFAETNNTRLFLGINDDGLVGLHFNAFPRHGKDRHLSLWSLPYVDKNKVDVDSKETISKVKDDPPE